MCRGYALRAMFVVRRCLYRALRVENQTVPSTSNRGGFALWLGVVALVLSGQALGASDLSEILAGPVETARRAAPALGVHVVDIASDETVYEYEADELRIIASNTKLFTTATALDSLGPGYFFETNVMMRGELRDHQLVGDLAVIGGGDPNISGRLFEGDSLAVMRDWAVELQDLGVHRVQGDVYLISGLFEPPRVHPDWPKDQLSRWYEAPVEALSFNDNSVLVRVWPGHRGGQPARVEIVPDLPIFEVRNSAKTTDSSKQHKVIIDRVDGSNVLTVSGSVFRHAAPVESWVAVADPLLYFGAALRKAFSEASVELAGRILVSPNLPLSEWKWAAGYRTDLMTTAEVINKRSQNFFAESLLKLMGAELCGAGSWEAGRSVVREFLFRVGIEPETYSMADGSGMSRGNRFSPKQITQLLSYMYFHPRGRDFLLTLPYSGEPGLKWETRLAEPPYRGNVFAKTGSLSGVSTLSGYAKATSGKIYAFSILGNKSRSNWQSRKAQDGIVRAIIDNG